MGLEDLIPAIPQPARGDWATAYGYFADDLPIRIPAAPSGRRSARPRAAYIDAAVERHAGRVEVELVDMLASESASC